MTFTGKYMRPYGARLAVYGVFVVLSTAFVMATALSVTDFLKLLFDGGRCCREAEAT